MGLMEGKRGIVFGVANNMGAAWGIARKLSIAEVRTLSGNNDIGVGKARLFDLAGGAPGEIHYVDAGFSVNAA